MEASKQELPYTVISDGRVLTENLTLLGKDESWVTGYLSGKGVRQGDVMLLTLTESGKTSLICRETR